MNIQDNEIKGLLLSHKQFSVYGFSPNSEKPSHYVPVYMRDQGWDMVGIYPKAHSESDFKVFGELGAVPSEYRKFLVVFRASENIPELVDEVLAVGGVEILWLQLGISHPEAEARAEKAGLKVVSNRCLIIEHKKF